MRGISIGFALGVACLQQQAVLPGVAVTWAFVLMFGSACAIAFYLSRFRAASLIAAALVVGFGYAAWCADTRLQRVLPVAFENRNIELTGFVRGLPMQGADSTRFLFEVVKSNRTMRHCQIFRVLYNYRG